MTGQEIEKLLKEITRLRKLVYHDDLVGILNRRGFLEAAGREFELFSLGGGHKQRRSRSEVPFTIVFIDIDNFKAFNDQFGHDIGDRVLKHVALTLQKALRKNDILARWGGEEFIAALVGADAKTAPKVAEKLRKVLQDAKLDTPKGSLGVTGSFGVSVYRDENSLTELIEAADKAMYRAKDEGRNRVVTLQ